MLNLYKIPGAFIFGFMGAFGTGKTLGLLEQGLKMASVYNLRIVANFPINQKQVNRYCKLKKYPPIFCYYVDTSNKSVLDLISWKQAVILLDEAGIELFSRGFKDNQRQEIFKQLFQIRKNKSFIFYSCQYIDQVDKQMRDNTHIWLLCNAYQRFSKRRRFSVLYSRFVIAFNKTAFQKFMSNPEKQSKKIYPLYLSGWRFSYSLLALSKLLGFIRHLKLSYLYAISQLTIKYKKQPIKNKTKKNKPKKFKLPIIYIILNFWWLLHHIDQYFKNLDFLSDEDLLFKIYDSFGQIGTQTKKPKLKYLEYKH